MDALKVFTVPTKPYEGQKPGTSGLRKTVKEFQKPNYTENFVHAILTAVSTVDKLEKSLLIVGGDGRFYCQDAVQIIVKMCAAKKVRRSIDWLISPIDCSDRLFTSFTDLSSIARSIDWLIGLGIVFWFLQFFESILLSVFRLGSWWLGNKESCPLRRCRIWFGNSRP